MNYQRVIHTLGSFAAFISSTLAVPALWALWYGEYWTLPSLLAPAVGGVGLGLFLRHRFRNAPRSMHRREGLLIVSGSWLVASAIGALPFLISGMIPGVVDALFESVSGFTTTGSTIMTAIDGQPLGLLFWRSMTHWLGGMGIIVLFVAILPALGVGGRLLYEFEVPGVETEGLTPRIRETAMMLWKIYLGFSIVEALLLMLFGMSFYDALTHTFGTVATGGFSTHDASVSHFDSVPIEVVITVFMLLAGVNFSLYTQVRRKGLGVFFRDPEFRTYAGIMIGLTLLFSIVLVASETRADFGSAVRDSSFQVVAVGTTTGFGTADFDVWPNGLRFILVLLMFVGGSSGSTAGGMKVFRIMLVLRFVGHEIRHFIRPHRVQTLMIGRHSVPPELIQNTLAFFALVVLIFAGSSTALVAIGLDMETACSSVAATLGNIGPGLNLVGPTLNFSEIPVMGKLLHILLMIFGRLEIFTLVAILMPSMYRD